MLAVHRTEPPRHDKAIPMWWEKKRPSSDQPFILLFPQVADALAVADQIFAINGIQQFGGSGQTFVPVGIFRIHVFVDAPFTFFTFHIGHLWKNGGELHPPDV